MNLPRLVFWLLVVPVTVIQASATPQKVMIVLFENMDFAEVVKQPFFKKLGQEGALFNDFHAEVHPSQPNYIALVSGDLNGCSTDSKINIDAPNIVDLLEAAGKSWKVYAEDYPGNCFLGSRAGKYVRKHNPLISFRNVQKNPDRCQKIVNARELWDDIDRNEVPHFSLYIPNMDNDGHDTSASFSNRWYEKTFGPLLQNPHFMDDLLLVTTFDESNLLSPGNHIYTSFYGPQVQRGAESQKRYDHYSLLRTVEDLLQLGTLSKQDARATPILDVWQ